MRVLNFQVVYMDVYDRTWHSDPLSLLDANRIAQEYKDRHYRNVQVIKADTEEEEEERPVANSLENGQVRDAIQEQAKNLSHEILKRLCAEGRLCWGDDNAKTP